jgi:hypothetical protein
MLTFQGHITVRYYYICLKFITFNQVALNDGYGIDWSSCECCLGLFECHHVAAALLYGYDWLRKKVVKTYNFI